MVQIELQGGLGNQMFQYSAAKALSIRLQKRLILDLRFFEKNTNSFDGFTARNYELNIFNLSDNTSIRPYLDSNLISRYDIVGRVLNSFKKRVIFYSEPSLRYDQFFFNLKSPVFIKGYFQSEKYFQSIRDKLITTFKFPSETVKGLDVVEDMLKIDSKTVSIHVRRGDYANSVLVNKIHGTCSIKYYQSAVNLIDSFLDDAHYFIFSDDISWAKNNLLINNRCIVVDTRTLPPWCDMYLMSICNHNIIANSSYSWWGAWLNKNKDKIVIAPRKWYADNEMNLQTGDLIPSEWIRI